MDRDAYGRFSERLRERLAADERVLGLVALGSMSGEPPPDRWSDHDFFVISRPGEQERMRTELSWLPDGEEIVLAYRETAHGVKVLYRDAHLLEFAVFDPEELSVARVNRFHVLLDRGGIADRMRALRERTAGDLADRRPDPRWLAGQMLTALLVGAGRYGAVSASPAGRWSRPPRTIWRSCSQLRCHPRTRARSIRSTRCAASSKSTRGSGGSWTRRWDIL